MYANWMIINHTKYTVYHFLWMNQNEKKRKKSILTHIHTLIYTLDKNIRYFNGEKQRSAFNVANALNLYDCSTNTTNARDLQQTHRNE